MVEGVGWWVQANPHSCQQLASIVLQAFGRGDNDRKDCREKPLSEYDLDPYRKPTQVGEESILRRASDASLRNSAKWPRTLAIRGAPFRGGRSEEAQATV